MGSLIVYYSWTGNTEAVAGEISQITGGKLEKLIEVKPRKSFAGSAFSAILGSKSRLEPLKTPLNGDTDSVFLGTPVWASHSTPAVNTFLNKTDFTGKKVFLFFTLASSEKPEKVIQSITKRIEKKGGKVCDSFFVQTKMHEVIAPEAFKDSVSSWVEGLHL